MPNLYKRKQMHQPKGSKPPVPVKSDEDVLDDLLAEYLTLKKNLISGLNEGKISKEAFMKDVGEHLMKNHAAEENRLERLATMFEQYIFCYGKLTPLLEDKDVSDIQCFAYDNIRIKVKGKRRGTDIKFRSPQEFKNFVNYVATRNRANISDVNAIQRFVDNKSSEDFIYRFTVTMPLVNTYGEPYLVIRKVPKNFPEIPDLIREGMLTGEIADILVKRFRTGSTLICGGNSAGKTTLLNALKETLPEDMSVLISQQADELTSKHHPATFFMHSLPENSESKVHYDLGNISNAGLTFDIDFFIIGEVKGREALYLLNAAYSGQLCAATIHAPGADKALDKTVDYAMQAGSGYSKEELMQYLTEFQTIVFMKDYRVNQVYGVKGWNEAKRKPEYEVLYREGEPQWK